MPINYHHLKTRPFPEIRQTYRIQDTMLYALSLGLGQSPLDPAALAYVYEDSPGGLRLLPSQAVVLGYPGFWVREPDTGLDWVKLLHGEQRLTIHRPLPPSGTVVGRSRITHVIDKGEDKGAILVVERLLEDTDGGPYATLQQVNFCRGDGGYSQLQGGQPSDDPLPALLPTPDHRPPEWVDEQPTRPEMALLYRLLADPNPLHANPFAAHAAGFDRPILHGLASYGLACRAVVRQCAGNDPTRLRRLDLRFASPVYPGETLRTEIWKEGSEFRFRTTVVERDRVVMSHGCASLFDAA